MQKLFEDETLSDMAVVYRMQRLQREEQFRRDQEAQERYYRIIREHTVRRKSVIDRLLSWLRISW